MEYWIAATIGFAVVSIVFRSLWLGERRRRKDAEENLLRYMYCGYEDGMNAMGLTPESYCVWRASFDLPLRLHKESVIS